MGIRNGILLDVGTVLFYSHLLSSLQQAKELDQYE